MRDTSDIIVTTMVNMQIVQSLTLLVDEAGKQQRRRVQRRAKVSRGVNSFRGLDRTQDSTHVNMA